MSISLPFWSLRVIGGGKRIGMVTMGRKDGANLGIGGKGTMGRVQMGGEADACVLV